MLYPQDRNVHRPLHFFQEDNIYFLTGRTFREEHFFNTKEKKQILLNILSQAIEQFSISLYAWIILNNHYHLEFGFVPRGRCGMTPLAALPNIKHNSASAVTPNLNKSIATPLARFVNMLHSKSTVFLNKLDSTFGRRIWYQY